MILLSDFTKTDFLKAVPFKGRTFVLNNFVPDIFFNNTDSTGRKDEGTLRLVAVGALKPLKNFEYLLEVFEHLKNEDICLDIFGSGDSSAYDKVINKNGLKVRMMGFNDNMAVTLRNYDLFIMPSKFEGFPLVLFEAMASRVPLMLSNIAPVKSIAGEHAIYFDLDNAAATAETIKQLMYKRRDIIAMAQKAKQYAEHTVRRETYITGLLSIYEQLSNTRAG